MSYLRFILFAAVFFLSAMAFAQGDLPPSDVSSAGLIAIAMALNTGGVFFLVALIKRWIPNLRRTAPHWIPIIAMASGPVLNAAGAFLTELFNHPVDFSPVVGAFGGTAAVAFHQVRHQRRKVKGSRLPR